MTLPDRARPVEPLRRIKSIDIVRGLALLGVLMVNMLIFKSPYWYTQPTPTEITGAASRAGAFIIETLFTAKFYAIFSFLFGLGFFIIMRRAEIRGADVDALYRRRLWGLLAIGLVHMIFIWSGDILVVYAVTGFALLSFRRTGNHTLRKWIVGLLIGSIILLGLVYMMEAGHMSSGEYAQWIGEMTDRAVQAFTHGAPLEILAFRWSVELPGLLNQVFLVPNVLAYFLAGFYAGRLGLFRDPERHMTSIRRWQLMGLAMGGIFVAVYLVVETGILPVAAEYRMAALGVATFLGAPFLSAFYVSTVMLALRRPWGRLILGPLAASGPDGPDQLPGPVGHMRAGVLQLRAWALWEGDRGL